MSRGEWRPADWSVDVTGTVEMIIGRSLRYCLQLARSAESRKNSAAYVRQHVKVLLLLTVVAMLGLSVPMAGILAVLFLLQETGATPRVVYPWTYRILAAFVLGPPVVGLVGGTVSQLIVPGP